MIKHASVNNNGTTYYYPIIDPCTQRLINIACAILEMHCNILPPYEAFHHNNILTMNNNMHISNNATKQQPIYCSNINATTMNNINHQHQNDSNTDMHQSNN